MGEQFGEFSGGLLREAALYEIGDGRSDFRLHHLIGFEGHETAGIMGLPARDEVGDHEATFPVVFDVSRGDTPQELVRFGHLHAGARRLHLEGPDAGGSGRAAVVADMEVLGFGFEEAGARVIGQARRTGRDVGGRGDDEGGLDGVLEFPDLLGHPAGQRALLEADLAVEGMHRLVLHFPSGVGAFDDVDDAGGIALVGVIVDGEAVAELVESDLLRVTQAEMDHFEIRTIGLKTEDCAAVMGIVFLTFLGGEVEAAVADGTPDAAVRTDSEAVHVMAGKRDADAEAFFDHLALGGDAVVLGVLQHPELRDAGEVDVVVPRHYASASAVEDIVELIAEDLLGRESAVGLLAAHVADQLGLGRHPLDGLLGLPLLVHR